MLGVGTTGYAKDILKDVLAADVALVETVAHTQSALHFYEDVDVICDVGGQDIKIIILNERAGQGLQAQHAVLGGQRLLPAVDRPRRFGLHGRGVRRHRLLGAVVCRSSATAARCSCSRTSSTSSARAGRRRRSWPGSPTCCRRTSGCTSRRSRIWRSWARNFVLQGGTQYNLAAVKAQVDFIESRFKDKGLAPERHRAQAHRRIGRHRRRARSRCGSVRERAGARRFIGLDAVAQHHLQDARATKTRAATSARTSACARSSTCKTRKRDVAVGAIRPNGAARRRPRVAVSLHGRRSASSSPPARRARSRTSTTCARSRRVSTQVKKANPNLAESRGARGLPAAATDGGGRSDPGARLAQPRDTARGSRRCSAATTVPHRHAARAQHVLDGAVLHRLLRVARARSQRTSSAPTTRASSSTRTAPSAARSIRASRARSASRTSTTCSISAPQEEAARLHLLPDDRLPADVPAQARRPRASCPTVATTPEAVKAAFTKEGDLFEEMGIEFHDTFVNLAEQKLLARQMYEQLARRSSGSPREENERAVAAGLRGARRFDATCGGAAREVLDRLEARAADRHRGAGPAVPQRSRRQPRDPGGVPEARVPGLRRRTRCRSTTTCSTRLFGDEVRARRASPTRWRSPTSGRTPTARTPAARCGRPSSPRGIPNLVALELSSFKCGHDAPIYTVVEEIIETLGHAVLLLQGHRREQADRLDQDPRRDHRLLPEALPRGHPEEEDEAGRGGGDSRRVRGQAPGRAHDRRTPPSRTCSPPSASDGTAEALPAALSRSFKRPRRRREEVAAWHRQRGERRCSRAIR